MLDIRADWPAYCEMSGMRIWGHKIFPCVCCDIPKIRMLEYTRVSITEAPFEDYTQEQYLEDCKRMQKARLCFCFVHFSFVGYLLALFRALSQVSDR